MTYCRTVRDNKQRFVGDVYLLHEEPLSLQDTLELDPGYIDFLTDQAQQAGGSKQNRQFASALLKDIDRLTELRSPTQREVIERRLTRSEERRVGKESQDRRRANQRGKNTPTHSGYSA